MAGLDGHLPHACPAMRQAIADPRVPVIYVSRFREFGILTILARLACALARARAVPLAA